MPTSTVSVAAFSVAIGGILIRIPHCDAVRHCIWQQAFGRTHRGNLAVARAGMAQLGRQMKYHYTTGQKLPLILADEVIRPTELYLRRGERAVAWFTTHEIGRAHV